MPAPFPTISKRHSRFRIHFGLRTMLVVTTLIGTVMGWTIHEVRRGREIEQARIAIDRYCGHAAHQWPANPSPIPEWMQDYLGHYFLARIEGVSGFVRNDAAIGNAKRLKVGYLKLGRDATDRGLEQLQGLDSLSILDIFDSQITDDGLAYLEGLDGLTELSVNVDEITDAGVSHLARLTRLTKLSLESANISDVGLAQLDRLTNLQTLNLQYTKVTEAGIRRLQQALPNCLITSKDSLAE